MAEQLDDLDFALAAFRADGRWQVQQVTEAFLEDVDALVHGLRRFPADDSALGLVGIDEDFFLLVRVTEQATSLLLSDVTAAEEWELARETLHKLRIPAPDEEDDEAQVPAGDLGMLADLGVPADELGQLLEEDLYPDELLSRVAGRLGFGPEFDEAVGLTSA